MSCWRRRSEKTMSAALRSRPLAVNHPSYALGRPGSWHVGHARRGSEPRSEQ